MKIKKDEIGLDSGVSELIGAILLVSLVVMLMMVVTTVLISQPKPEKIPELSASISFNGTGVTGTPPYEVNIAHIGGDTLQWGEYRVVIDGTEVGIVSYYNSVDTLRILNKEEWSFNNPTIKIKNLNSPPNNVQVYYYGPSNKVLLAKTNFV
jgi:FlaG/FlaF family flagellin (archaellin)